MATIKDTSGNLTRLYIVALSTIAALSIAGQVLIQLALNNQQKDSYVVNLAGRQRMLSQRITKNALKLREDPANAHARKEIDTSLTLWKQCHEGLKSGDETIGLPDNNSAVVAAMFREIDPYFRQIYENGVRIAGAGPADTLLIRQALEVILNNEGPFLNGMSAIVFQYDKEAADKVSFLKRTEYILLTFTLLVLLLEGLFIFRPAVMKIRKTIYELIQSERKASNLARKLYEVNKALKKSLKEVQDISFALDQANILVKTDQYGIITYVNEKFCETFGYPEEELIGNRFSMVNSHYHSRAFFSSMWETIAAGKVWNGEVRNEKKNGDYVWLDATIVPVKGEDGAPYQYIGIYTNITQKFEQRINEQRIRSVSIIQGQEEERKRIARELHDGIGQMLTALKFNIQNISGTKSKKEQEKLKEINELIRQTITETRRVSFNLMPSVLSDFGLISALKILCEEVTSHSGIPVKFEVYGAYRRLDRASEVSLYRIIQEAINNALKYAKASYIDIRLFPGEEKTEVFVIDDGAGFDFIKVLSNIKLKKRLHGVGNGIANMQERTSLINGEFNIDSAPGEGTIVHIQVPSVSLEK